MKNFRLIFLQQILLEFRERSSIAGVALYLLSTVLIIYFTFSLRLNLINTAVWSALFWIAALFTAINAVGKSFLTESRGKSIYYFSLVSAHQLIMARMAYNAILCFLLFIMSYVLFSLIIFNPVVHTVMFLITLLLAATGFASSLTLVSGIAARATNSHVLMAILSFPVIISVLLLVIRITRNCVEGLDISLNYPDLGILLAINMISVTISYLLFPYIWRS